MENWCVSDREERVCLSEGGVGVQVTEKTQYASDREGLSVGDREVCK